MISAEKFPAQVIRKFSLSYLRSLFQKPSVETIIAAPVADLPPLTQKERLEHVASEINKCDGPVIDVPDPIDTAIFDLRMAIRKGK